MIKYLNFKKLANCNDLLELIKGLDIHKEDL